MAGGPQVPNQAKLDGLNPLAYLGVRPSSPPQLLVQTRNPTINDNKYALGTWWLNNNVPYDLFILVNLAQGIATWQLVSVGGGTVSTLTTNVGGPVGPTGGNINVVGDGVTITGSGNPGTSTITFSTVSSGVVSTLTGNAGGAVSPTAGNINIVGSGLVTVTGNPGTSTLTITDSGAVADSFPTDAGTATPSGGILNVFGGTAARDIHTSGSGNTIHIDLDNAITLGDLVNITGSDALTIVTGDITLDAGDIHLHQTNTAGTEGVITIGGSAFLSCTAADIATIYLGAGAGRLASTGVNNIAIGAITLDAVTTGSQNTCVGVSSATPITTGSGNIALGYQAGNSWGAGSSNNINIGNVGGAESAHIRIGTHGTQTACFVAGIDGVNVGSVATVVTEASDQLGTAVIQGGTGITVTAGANTITISGSGTTVFNYTNVNTTPYVVLTTDEYLSVDSSGGAITVQLPNAAPSVGRSYIIKDRTGSAATHNITVTTVGGAVNIDGATTFVMNTAFESVNVLWNGTTYEIW